MKFATVGIIAGIVAIVIGIVVLVGVYFFVYKRVVQSGERHGIVSSGVKAYKNAKQAAESEKRLYATGRDAEAVILEVHDTDFATKRYTELELLLEVRPENENAFRVRTRKMISQSHTSLFQPGAKLKVKYDPAHPEQIALVSSPVPGSAEQKDATHRLEELKTLRERGLISDDEYKKKRQEILNNL
ncbi:MAG: SHOCT domain-containing protein [Deltaproteobacteria bacterium]|nr:SHOCT domain-containing protein [Deltaproteobacteria bacterium]